MIDPFEQLSKQDRKNAIDIAVATTILVNRIPTTGPQLDGYITQEFAHSYALPATLAAGALRDIGKRLTQDDWTFTLTKEGQSLVTEFKAVPNKKDGDSQ